MVDAQQRGVQWRGKYSPRLPGKNKGNLEMKMGASSLRTLALASIKDFLRCGCQLLDLSQFSKKKHVPITGLITVSAST